MCVQHSILCFKIQFLTHNIKVFIKDGYLGVNATINYSANTRQLD